jgi:hypothetical protein
MEINYSTGKVSKEYHCHKCLKHGVKLWRIYQSSFIELLCAKCLCKQEGLDEELVDRDGRIYDTLIMAWTDTIGDYCPAVPDEEGVSFWGYTSVPQEGVYWWKHLPNY